MISFFQKPGGFSIPQSDELWIVFGLVFFLSWWQALTPPIANDALAYHLAHPKQFIQHHRIGAIPLSRESLWPYQTEMLFTLGLLLEGTSLAQLFHWIFFPLTALAVYSFTEKFGGRSAAKWAALFFVFTPAVFAQSSQAYVDLALGFYVFAAFYAFILFRETERNRYALLSGFLCGGAMATKYLGLGAFLILCVFFVRVSRSKMKTLIPFAVSAFLIGGIWYLRSWILTGNPVYPFFYKVFGGAGYPDRIAEGVGMGSGLGDLSLFLWNITLHPASFGGEMVGPFFLMLLPVAPFYIKRMNRPLLFALIFAVFYMVFLFFMSQQVRFFLSAAPFLCVVAGWVVQAMRKERSKLTTAVIAMLIFIFAVHAGIYIYRSRNAWAVVLGREPASEYLRRMERSYRGFDYLKENARPGAKLFNAAEIRFFYNPGLSMTYGGGNFSEAFLDRENFDYLWLSGSSGRLFDYARKKGYKLVYSYEFTERPAVFKNYIYGRIPQSGDNLSVK